MDEVKQGLKNWFTMIVLWMGFGSITAYAVNTFIGINQELIGIVNMVLPMLCFLTFHLLALLAAFTGIIYYLLTLPLRLFRRKKKTQSTEEKQSELTVDRSVVLVSVITYVIAGLFFRWFYGGQYWIMVYAVMGLCWGIILSICLQRGILDIEDML